MTAVADLSTGEVAVVAVKGIPQFPASSNAATPMPQKAERATSATPARASRLTLGRPLLRRRPAPVILATLPAHSYSIGMKPRTRCTGRRKIPQSFSLPRDQIDLNNKLMHHDPV